MGATEFYKRTAMAGKTGYMMHKGTPSVTGAVPLAATAGAASDPGGTLAALKASVDAGRTVVLFLDSYGIQDRHEQSTSEPGISLFNMGGFVSSNPSTEDQYHFSNDNPSNAIGHTVLMVGHLQHQGCEFVVVQDNDHTTPRFVGLPFDQACGGTRSVWEALHASFYVDAPQPQSWVFGALGQSCTEACADHGGCHVNGILTSQIPSFNWLQSDLQGTFATAFGLECVQYTGASNLPTAPFGIYLFEQQHLYCAPSSVQQFQCDSSSPDHRRMCSCGAQSTFTIPSPSMPPPASPPPAPALTIGGLDQRETDGGTVRCAAWDPSGACKQPEFLIDVDGTSQLYRLYVTEFSSTDSQTNWLSFYCLLATGNPGVDSHSSDFQDIVLDSQHGRRINTGLYDEPMGFFNNTAFGDLVYQIEDTDSTQQEYWTYQTSIKCSGFLPGSLPPSTPPPPPLPPPPPALMGQIGSPSPAPPLLMSGTNCLAVTASGSQSNDAAQVDGVYNYQGVYNGFAYYQKSSSLFIYVTNDRWRIGNSLGSNGPYAIAC